MSNIRQADRLLDRLLIRAGVGDQQQARLQVFWSDLVREGSWRIIDHDYMIT